MNLKVLMNKILTSSATLEDSNFIAKSRLLEAVELKSLLEYAHFLILKWIKATQALRWTVRRSSTWSGKTNLLIW